MRKERLSGTLTRNNRPLVSYLAGLGIDEGTIAKTLPFGNQLERDASVWTLRDNGGERGNISRLDAEMMFRSAFGDTRKRNSLASYHQGGGK
jgi:hypothetical protein